MGLFDRIKRAFTGEDEVIKHEETKESIVIEKYDKGMEKTRRSFSDRLIRSNNPMFSPHFTLVYSFLKYGKWPWQHLNLHLLL